MIHDGTLACCAKDIVSRQSCGLLEVLPEHHTRICPLAQPRVTHFSHSCQLVNGGCGTEGILHLQWPILETVCGLYLNSPNPTLG